ncbi:response regulator [Pararobbsia silviterrae]|uniref:response regulator n=1 Tax=Pararobbsia silviterrae TaxID=1792498 RepID=UPI001F0BC1AA|nr:response regulator [Pararobbsia silviterrae]
MKTILLVDDDARILAPLRALLEAEGYRVLLAANGEEAVRVTDIEHPELIVTDWMMPVLDGVAFCRHLRAHRATACIPIVMLTAATPPMSAETLWNALLRKPVPIARLIGVIRDLLSLSRSGKRG